jgi:hypothetical protein
VDYQL